MLTAGVPARWSVRGVGEFFDQVVGVRLEPGDVVSAGWLRWCERWQRFGWMVSSGGAPGVEAFVRGDAIPPRSQRRPPFEPAWKGSLAGYTHV